MFYTKALIENPSAAVFRNMGSAYQAIGNMQMAFASFQQALQVDPTGIFILRSYYLFNFLHLCRSINLFEAGFLL